MTRSFKCMKTRSIFFLVVNRTSSCLRQIVNESFINLISNSFKGMTISRQMIVHWPKYLETVVNYSKDWPTPIQKEIQTILLSIYHENQKQREGYQYSILSSLYKLANLLYQLPLKNKNRKSRFR